MEYGGFEGIIPKGQYGGGTVMVWDQGTWEPQPGHTDVDAGLRDGSLKFVMHGSKMLGKWTLIRMHDKPAAPGEKSRWRSSGKPNWLLIKEHDDFERPPDAPAVTEDSPLSAVTGRSLDQIAANEDHVWNSKETAGTGQAWYRQQPSDTAAPEAPPAKTPAKRPKAARGAKSKPSAPPDGLPAEAQPTFIKPELAQEAEDPPDGSGWLHELKLDGYRIQARKSGADVKLLTRSGLDWTHRMPAVAAAVAALPNDALTLDGEVVVLAPDGTSSFADLQASFQNDEQHPLTYFVFDLLHLDGGSTRDLPLLTRKQRLATVLEANRSDALRFSEHLTTDGAVMFRHACELHAEGIVSKRADSPYRSTRSADWLKSKCLHESEFVIGGYTLSSDSDKRVGSLLLGYYEDGKLIHAGRTGTGFTQKSRAALFAQLQPLAQKTSPFASITSAGKKGALWVQPKLVAQIRFATWTADGNVRQAAFLGLREDKPAAEVHREGSAPTPKSSHSPRKSVRSSVPKPAIRAEQPLPANLRLTHPAKIVDKQTGVTKQQLAEFYWAVAPHMLPYVAGRPLSLVRCPEGTAG